MNALTKLNLLYHILHWRVMWAFNDTRFEEKVPGNPKFMGPRQAIRACISDGDVLALSGLGGCQHPTILYYAVRDVFRESGHPKDLTVIAIGGMGGRGIVPGTSDELAQPGLARRFMGGHLETFKNFLKLADKGLVEIQVIPQGTMALMLDAQMRGVDIPPTSTGTGTFVDPRVGGRTNLMNPEGEQFVSVKDGKLLYRIPKINVALFNCPAADREGNIYVKNCSMKAESFEIAKSAKRNGGKVIVNVAEVVEKGYDDIYLPAEDVDAIVVFKRTYQVLGALQRKPWKMFTPQSDVPVKEGVARLKFVNQFLGITPRRTPVDSAMARLAASIFVKHAKKKSFVNVGVGLPEEVCRLLLEGGILDDITLFTESGVLGGVPAPGVFFGSAVCPQEMLSSAEIFKRCYQNLDVTILGVLQADSLGNVNVSKRGPKAINFVGPGGFIDLTTTAKMVLFVCNWMAHGRFALEGSKVKILERGDIKFTDKVDEVTFNGAEALKAGKKVFYVTNVGAFQLTSRGVELMCVMPGIDVQKDILQASKMKILLPKSGDVPVVEENIVTGQGFKLAFAQS